MKRPGQPPFERFAAASDELLRSEETDANATAGIAPELQMAHQLRAFAAAGVPDPEFVDGLREELRQRARAARGYQPTLRYAVLETPIGTLALAYRDGKAIYCAAVETESRPNPAAAPFDLAAFERAVARALGDWPQREETMPARLERAVRDHLAGRRRFTDVDLSWLKPFQRRVLEKTAEIPRGEVRPYGWIAREIGAAGAVRAVGTALGHNPLPFLIPCHRVVRSDGQLGEYSGGGPAVKERVLSFENVAVEQIGRGPRFNGCRSTHIVCYPSCRAGKRVKPENSVPFISLAKAAASGYRPCKLCRPV